MPEHATARSTRKQIAGYFEPEVARALRRLAMDRDTTQQALLAEALNDPVREASNGALGGRNTLAARWRGSQGAELRFAHREADLIVFRISARTVLELGSELISSDIIAFYELIKNGFDARTRNGVDVRFDIVLRKNTYLTLRKRVRDETVDLAVFKREIRAALAANASEAARTEFEALIDGARTHVALRRALKEAQVRCNTITVSDTGSGMSRQDLENNFLVIGTASRKRDVEAALRRGERESPYLGEKGIGRLSAMRLGDRLRVDTARAEDPIMNRLEIDWTRFADLDAMLDQIAVAPEDGPAKPAPTWSGTTIVIADLGEDWTETRARRMAEYEFARLTDPFLDQKSRPRVALFWNSERVAIPWMSRDLIAAAHARVHGEYRVTNDVPELDVTLEALNLGFDHPHETQRIVVPLHDLQAAIIGKDGTVPDSALVSVGPFAFEAHWYNRRPAIRVRHHG